LVRGPRRRFRLDDEAHFRKSKKLRIKKLGMKKDGMTALVLYI